jgi:hypothetical protein
VELLVVIGIIALLAGLLLPALTRAKNQSKRAACFSNLRQIGIGFALYLPDNNDHFPDRRDLKTSLGYMPWTTWPTSDPRGGWAAVVLSGAIAGSGVFTCPAIVSPPLSTAPQCVQQFKAGNSNAVVNYWFWRFDRPDDPVPLDDFWGKSTSQCLHDLQQANNPTAGQPNGMADIELAVDPYFPKTIPAVPADLKGKTPHIGGRDRLFLDMHAEFDLDARLK